MKLEEVARRLRRLGGHLDSAPLTDCYDRLLLDAGQMLEMPTPAMARGRRILTPEARAELEQVLTEAGLDVRPTLSGGAR